MKLARFRNKLFGINALKKDFSSLQLKIEECFALEQINQLFNNTEFYINHNHFSFSPSGIAHVLNEIFMRQRRSIIEFGSGMSTIYIAKALEVHKIKTSFISVDADRDWILVLQNMLNNLGIDQHVDFLHAPTNKLEPNHSFPGQDIWYDTASILSKIEGKAFDLVIADGPCGKTCPYARNHAIPFLLQNLSADYAVFLDDVHRSDEKAIVKHWKKLLDSHVEVHNRYAYFTNSNQIRTAPHISKY